MTGIDRGGGTGAAINHGGGYGTPAHGAGTAAPSTHGSGCGAPAQPDFEDLQPSGWVWCRCGGLRLKLVDGEWRCADCREAAA